MLQTNYLLLLLLLPIISCNKAPEIIIKEVPEIDFKWVEKPEESYAKEKIYFVLSGNFIGKNLKLGISNDFGNSLISRINKRKNVFVFKIPESFSKVSGILLYSLSYNNSVIDKGSLKIIPVDTTALLETYCGPPYMVASVTDYSMLVVIPNDIYDNPNSGEHYITESDNIREVQEFVKTDDLLSYRKIYSRVVKGKVFTKAFIDTVKSKTSELTIIANNAMNFTISYTRNTNHADGKELTTLKTSVIRDIHNNIIENGTLVSFYLTYNDTHLKVYGKVVNGIAIAQFVHPEEEREYTVQAFVENVCSSNIIKINYKLATF